MPKRSPDSDVQLARRQAKLAVMAARAARADLDSPPQPPPPLTESFTISRITYKQRWIRCGKRSCILWHGPYWYAYQRTAPPRPRIRNALGSLIRGKTVCTYVGKSLPVAITAQRSKRS